MYSTFNEYIWILGLKVAIEKLRISWNASYCMLSMKEILYFIRILKRGRRVSFRKNE
jgi:hypothetical protein